MLYFNCVLSVVWVSVFSVHPPGALALTLVCDLYVSWSYLLVYYHHCVTICMPGYKLKHSLY